TQTSWERADRHLRGKTFPILSGIRGCLEVGGLPFESSPPAPIGANFASERRRPPKTLITPALFSRPLRTPPTGRRRRTARQHQPGSPRPVGGRRWERGQG